MPDIQDYGQIQAQYGPDAFGAGYNAFQPPMPPMEEEVVIDEGGGLTKWDVGAGVAGGALGGKMGYNAVKRGANEGFILDQVAKHKENPAAKGLHENTAAWASEIDDLVNADKSATMNRAVVGGESKMGSNKIVRGARNLLSHAADPFRGAYDAVAGTSHAADARQSRVYRNAMAPAVNALDDAGKAYAKELARLSEAGNAPVGEALDSLRNRHMGVAEANAEKAAAKVVATHDTKALSKTTKIGGVGKAKVLASAVAGIAAVGGLHNLVMGGSERKTESRAGNWAEMVQQQQAMQQMGMSV